jgi:hypothetical protein
MILKFFHIHFTEFGAVMTTVLPVLFKYYYKYCYSDSRRLWAVMKGEVWSFNICLFLTTYLYTFSLYENPSFIILYAEAEYISTRSWYRNINFLIDRRFVRIIFGLIPRTWRQWSTQYKNIWYTGRLQF